MNSIKNIAIENNETIFKLKNEIKNIQSANNITDGVLLNIQNDIDALKILNTTTFNIQGDVNILKYIHGQAFPIQGEEAKQVITSIPTNITASSGVTNLTNTISYTSNLAILPFNCILYSSNYHLTNIVFNCPLNIDSTLIIYFYPYQYSFNKNTMIATNKQITYIDLRKSPLTSFKSVYFPVNSTAENNKFNYDFTKLVFWMRNNNIMCFISDIAKTI